VGEVLVKAAEAAPFHLGYRSPLDGLRGVAILAVMAFHGGLIRGGFLGVDLFFVLSGFLITTLLLEERDRTGAIHLGRFYVRRALRLLPALFALVIACSIVVVLTGGPEEAGIFGSAALWVIFYLANWASFFGYPLHVLRHAWSLAIEEQFYLLWPGLLVLLARVTASRARLLGVVVAGVAASVLLRLWQWVAPDAVAQLYARLDWRGDALLVGCALGVLTTGNWLPASRTTRAWLLGGSLAAAAVLAAAFLGASWDALYMRGGGATLVALSAAALIVQVLVAPAGWIARLLAFRPLVRTGRISYGLYLWHFPIFFALSGLAYQSIHPALPRVLLAAVVTFLVAEASFRLLERPLLSLKDRFRDDSRGREGKGALARG
jgi:peptidoglycan/LPS O-acetylase OafA/YrhL